jgi:hypothetical protein
LENLTVCYDKCLNKFRNYMEKYRTDFQRYPYAFLVSTYLLSCKKNRELYFLTSPCTCDCM